MTVKHNHKPHFQHINRCARGESSVYWYALLLSTLFVQGELLYVQYSSWQALHYILTVINVQCDCSFKNDGIKLQMPGPNFTVLFSIWSWTIYLLYGVGILQTCLQWERSSFQSCCTCVHFHLHCSILIAHLWFQGLESCFQFVVFFLQSGYLLQTHQHTVRSQHKDSGVLLQ